MSFSSHQTQSLTWKFRKPAKYTIFIYFLIIESLAFDVYLFIYFLTENFVNIIYSSSKPTRMHSHRWVHCGLV